MKSDPAFLILIHWRICIKCYKLPRMKNWFLLFFFLALPSLAFAAEPAAGGLASAVKLTGLALPRFASLKSDDVNMRTGPGLRYPIEWRFQRKGLPVEITAEFDTWRRIRDPAGAEGWVHQSNLSGRRTFMVMPPKDSKDAVQPIFRKADTLAPLRAQAEPGFIGRLEHCKGDWCKVDADGHKGYMKKENIWGVYPNEIYE